MRFAATADLAVPIADAWAALADFAHYEGRAPERRVQVTRRGTGGPGTEWDLAFRLRGRERRVRTRLVTLDAPGRMAFAFAGEHLEGTARLDLVALARARCRLEVTLDILPKSLAARLFLGGLRLVKPRLDRRFRKGIARFGASVAARARAAGGGGAGSGPTGEGRGPPDGATRSATGGATGGAPGGAPGGATGGGRSAARGGGSRGMSDGGPGGGPRDGSGGGSGRGSGRGSGGDSGGGQGGTAAGR